MNASLLITSLQYEIKITGTLDALKSAVEALVFADYYDKESCLLPPSLVEYAGIFVISMDDGTTKKLCDTVPLLKPSVAQANETAVRKVIKEVGRQVQVD